MMSVRASERARSPERKSARKRMSVMCFPVPRAFKEQRRTRREPTTHGTMSSSQLFDSSFDYRSLLPTRAEQPQQQARPIDEEEGACGFLPDLSWRERLLGCATCMVAGYLLSFGSFWRLRDLVRGDPLPFVMNATIGNLLALCGSCFLSGPRSQMQKMWHDTRKVATAVYLGSLFLTLIVAFVKIPGQSFFLILLMGCQYVSITWYCLSYIPFAREAITNYVARRWSASEY